MDTPANNIYIEMSSLCFAIKISVQVVNVTMYPEMLQCFNSRHTDIVSALVDVTHTCVTDIEIISSHDAFFTPQAIGLMGYCQCLGGVGAGGRSGGRVGIHKFCPGH